MKVNLVLFKKNGTTKSFPLPSSVTVIGRRQDCDLCIPLMIISRKHCELNQDQEKLTIRDLGSRNGILINGLKVDKTPLNAGDRINLGPLTFAVQIDGLPANDSSILKPAKKLAKPESETASEDDKIDEFAEFADSSEFDDLDISEAQTGPGQSSTEFFDNIPDDLLDDLP